MSNQTVLFEREGAIGYVTINRSERMNALNSASLNELGLALEECENDQHIRAVIITGAGKAFSAGADISDLGSASAAHDFLCLGQNTFKGIENLSKPVIACINGMAFGGGVELALACDFRIASSDAVFGLPEVKIGILPAGGGTTRLSRVIGLTRAMEMVMLGETIGAEEALRIGLIGRMAPPDKLREETEKIAALLSLNAPLALKMIKNTLLAGLDCSHEEGLALELKAAEFLHGTEDFREGSIAFLQKRKPVFKGC